LSKRNERDRPCERLGLRRQPYPSGCVRASMRVAALFSGGKDSTYAAFVAMQRGWDLTHLISIRPEDPESMMFHVPNLAMTRLQAEAMGLPLIEEPAGRGEPEELDALRRAFGRAPVDGIVVGAIASDYQHARVQRVAERAGLRVFAPLWRLDPADLAREYLRVRMQIVFSSVSAHGLDASWLGRRWDEAAVEELLALREASGVHPTGEGGEFETLVLDAPPFRARLEVVRASPTWGGTSGTWRVDEARLVSKE